MNAQNLTQKSLEAIQTAQSMALENRNNYIMPEHLLYALVDQDGGLIPSLFGRMGVDCNAVLAELDTAISALPKVGSTTDAYLSPETNRILTAAEKSDHGDLLNSPQSHVAPLPKMVSRPENRSRFHSRSSPHFPAVSPYARNS